MPSLSIQFDPKVGPLIQIAIMPVGFKPDGPSSASVDLAMYMGRVDTGASCTCVTEKVIKALNLTPSGKQQVGGVHGSRSTNAYQFQAGLVFPQSQSAGGIMTAHVAYWQINGVEFEPNGVFDVLIGRDILCRGAFHMSFNGQAVLSV